MHMTSPIARHATNIHGKKGFLAWLAALNAAWRTRKHLSELDAHALKDLGLSEADVARELNRPIWQAPHHWIR